MASPSDDFEAFDIADDFYELGNEAKPDATTTLLSLPVELLLDITQHSRFSDIYSLTTVNKILHAVSIKRFYSLVAINATKFLSNLAASPGITGDSSISDMIPFFTCKSSIILRGLFARDQHLQSLRTLILCNSPGQASRIEFKLLCTIMQYIVNNAMGLNFMKLPTGGFWPPGADLIPVELTGVTYASTLRSLSVYKLSLEASNAIVQHMSSLRELHATTITPEFLCMSRPGEVYAHIEKFICTWDIDVEPDDLAQNAVLHNNLPRIMPNLQSLSVGYLCSEYQLRNQHASLTQQILESCYPLVENLKKLKQFEMTKVTEPTLEWRGSEVLNDEARMLQRFASLRPGLKWVTIRNHNPLVLFDVHYAEACVTWNRAGFLQEEDCSKDPLPVVTWTPNPLTFSRWWWWFGVFGDADTTRRMMVRHWKGESGIPSLEELKRWEWSHQRVMKESLHIY